QGFGRLPLCPGNSHGAFRRRKLPSAVTSKKRRPMDLISYDELMSNAGMSGFVSFLEQPSTAPAVPDPGKEAELPPDAAGAAAHATPAIPETRPEPAPKRSAGRQWRIRKAVAAEDGHSLAEQAVYDALWQTASRSGEGEDSGRTIRIGYHRLAQLTRLSWVS